MLGQRGGRDFVSLLSQKINQPIINAGVSGNTTRDALQRFDADVLSKDPRIVIVLLGGNDYLRKIDKSETFSNLQTIVDQIQNTGAVVILLGVRGGLLRDTYREDFDTFAQKNNLMYVPNVLDDIIGTERMADQIHPNSEGYAIIAERVAKILTKISAR